MLVVRILAILCVVLAEYVPNDEATSKKDVTSRGMAEYQDLDRLLIQLAENIEKKSGSLVSSHCKPPCLLYGSLHQINGLELATSRHVSVITSLLHVTPVEVDVATNTIYWSDKKKRVIKRTNLLNGVSEVLIGGEGGWYEGIAIEWISRLMYWTDRTHKRIEVARLDGSSRRILVNIGLVKPRAIVVDPKYGYMFWTDWGETKPCIERALLSGQERQALVTTNIRWPNGLVLDYNYKRVYFSEASYHRLESMDYDGSNRRVLYSDSSIQPFDLAMFGPWLFWSDWNSRSVEKILTNTGKRMGNFGVLTLDRVAGLVVMDASRQPRADSRCSVNNGGCSHLCFTTAVQSRNCGCPNGFQLLADSRTCDLRLSTPSATAIRSTQSRRTTTSTPKPTTVQTSPHSTGLVVRLVDGPSSNMGRVEVRYNGQWGTICDDYWDLRDAMVVCNMLGYQGAIAEFRSGYFGQGRGPIWLDDMNCIGNESSLEKCQHPGWGAHHCSHFEDAGVMCRPLNASVTPVRLVNGRGQYEGRVEVRHNGQWGTVCDDLWSKDDADIICRVLGYPGAVMATVQAAFGRGTGPIWLDNVRCRGHEHSIDECLHQGWGRSNCRHSEDAGVICQPNIKDEPLHDQSRVLQPSSSPVKSSDFSIICLPHAMYIRLSKNYLQDMTSRNFHPDSLHLNDPSCGVLKISKTYVLLGTSLNSCGTVRRLTGDSLTFTNKVSLGWNYSRRAIRSLPFEFSFRCSYIKTQSQRMLVPPERHGQGRIGQW